MSGKDLDYIRDIVEIEGFHYCFTAYSDFKEINDPDFHRLREAFIKANNDLCEYLNLDNLKG